MYMWTRSRSVHQNSAENKMLSEHKFSIFIWKFKGKLASIEACGEGCCIKCYPKTFISFYAL